MRSFKKILLLLLVVILMQAKACFASAWINDMRALFLSNNAVIYGINIRTFNAKDNNNNGIVEVNIGEERGNFINAIDRLDELASIGINTIHLLPVTTVGKVKALGTAGSLYAPASFSEINPQLQSPNSKRTAEDEMRIFVDECHSRKIRVIVDLPCCASYDMYLKYPSLFKKDKNQNPIIPADWTDVRLLDAGDENKINLDVYGLYQSFIDLMLNVGVDGVRADVASIKPAAFWKKLIDETRLRDPQFLFLADASGMSKEKISDYAASISYSKLLDAGFDGYNGNYSDFQNWKTSRDLFSNVEHDLSLEKRVSSPKSVIGSFSTHDQVSPILINGPQYSKMIIWLNSTLPLNPYYIDGFGTGDTYIYPLANRKAAQTYTDDDYYFEHRGQLDIFNFARKPGGKYYEVAQDFIIANKFRALARDVITGGSFNPLRTDSATVFAYERALNETSFVVIGNLDFKKTQQCSVYVPKLNKDVNSIPIKITNIPILSKGKISTELSPGEVQVLYFPTEGLK